MVVQPFQPKLMRIDRRAALLGLAATALSPVGCLGLGKWTTAKTETPTPPTQQGRLVAVWDKRVAYAPDPMHGGALYPGLVGRVFLFGSDMSVSKIGDGSLIIDLYDSQPNGPNSEPKLTDEFRIDADALRKLVKKDLIGDGYSIFMPWSNYKPDIGQIYINMLYTSASGEKFFHQSGTLAVDHSDTLERQAKGTLSRNPPVMISAPGR